MPNDYTVDFNVVRAALLAEKVWAPEAEVILEEVIDTTRKYAEEDLETWRISRVEERISVSGSIFDLSSGQDLILTGLSDTKDENRVKIIDYKRIGKWSEKSEILYLHGYQAQYYIAFAMKTFPPEAFSAGLDYEVRVKTSDGKLRRFGRRFDPVTTGLSITHDLVHLSNMVKGFEKQPSTPWPKNEDACFDFARPCPFRHLCWEGAVEPFASVPFTSYPLTPTYRRTLLRCPEKYHLTSLYAQEHNINVKAASDDLEPSGESALLGKAYHEGMRIVYEQLRLQQAHYLDKSLILDGGEVETAKVIEISKGKAGKAKRKRSTKK